MNSRISKRESVYQNKKLKTIRMHTVFFIKCSNIFILITGPPQQEKSLKSPRCKTKIRLEQLAAVLIDLKSAMEYMPK